MEQDLKDLFKDYNPSGMDSDAEFMKKFNRNIRAVEDVRRQVATERRHVKQAVPLAVAGGFVAGLCASFAFPWITKVVTLACDNLSIGPAELCGNFAWWIFVASAATITSFFLYSLKDRITI